jgi:hypothetical protein
MQMSSAVNLHDQLFSVADGAATVGIKYVKDVDRYTAFEPPSSTAVFALPITSTISLTASQSDSTSYEVTPWVGAPGVGEYRTSIKQTGFSAAPVGWGVGYYTQHWVVTGEARKPNPLGILGQTATSTVQAAVSKILK